MNLPEEYPCNKCKRILKLTTDNFYRKKNYLYGFYYTCKICCADYHKTWKETPTGKAYSSRVSLRDKFIRDKTAKNKKDRDRYAANKDIINARRRARRSLTHYNGYNNNDLVRSGPIMRTVHGCHVQGLRSVEDI